MIIMRKNVRYALALLLAFLLLGLFDADPLAMMRPGSRRFELNKGAATPNPMNFTHRVSNVWFTVTNWGFFGSKRSQDPLIDPETNMSAPSCEFPAGSNIEYLFQGALWIGAISGRDTLVSVGADGWQWVNEMYPDEAGSDNGRIWLRSTRPPTAYPRSRTDIYPDQIDSGDALAAKWGDPISEEDFIAVYTDTFTASFVEVDPNDSRLHVPLGLEVLQKSYSWSYEYAEDFILFDFTLTNIGEQDLKDVFVALYIDADCMHINAGIDGAQDDLTGYLRYYSPIEGIDSLQIATAWIADNDGDPTGGAFGYQSCTGVSGVRVVQAPIPLDSVSFNWWISHVNPIYDWGPQSYASNPNGEPFLTGGYGTPTGDAAKYRVISNHEFDYDQAYCAIDQGEEWLPPPEMSRAIDLANGFDTRYCYSFGPFASIPVDSSLQVIIAYVCGEGLHVRPDDADQFISAPNVQANVDEYYARLDFNDFAINSTWADWVYDNPGVDTDGDGYRGEYVLDTNLDTIWVKGDGVPDFSGPPPPPSPDLTFVTFPGTVKIVWNSLASENTEDTFGNGLDFEGYKLYWSKTGILDDYALLGAYDRIDYDSVYYDSAFSQWVQAKIPPIPYKVLAARHSDIEFQPRPPYAPINEPYSEMYIPHSYNRGFGDLPLEQDYPERELVLDSVVTTIVETGERVDTVDIRWYSKTYSGILESQPLFFAVTSYDYGDPRTRLSPLESSRAINAELVYPITEASSISEEVYVYPNPYRIDGGYADAGFEDPDHSGWSPWDRRIWFANLPGRCTIRIFTLDGDLVDTIEHDPAANPNAIESWNLISRNTQAVVSGMYIFSVESEKGIQLGKIAIIK